MKRKQKDFIFFSTEPTELSPSHPMASKNKDSDQNPFFFVKKEGEKIVYQTKNKTKFINPKNKAKQ